MAQSAARRITPPEGDAPAAVSAVTITPVQSAQDRDAFVLFPYALYRDDPNWVPPLIMERKDFLNPRKNAWFAHGSVELFLARQNGEVVGRIAAVNDPNYNRFHGTSLGFFGMFECIDDTAVARGLFDAAARWNKANGFSAMLGPVNFSTNYECTVLVEGFDAPPAVMMAYNPRYYPALYEANGFRKAKDTWAWELSSSVPPPEKVVRIAEKIRQREGVVVRSLNIKDFHNEVRRIKALYDQAWEKNWGFVPMTDAEFDQMAREMKPLVVPDLLLIAEVKGEPVGFSMTVPDANIALKAAGGRLTRYGLPIGLAKLLLASRRIKWLRLILLGVVPGYRKRGIDAILYLDTIRTAKRLGYTGGEISWTLEDNDLINRAIESMGGRRCKTYRFYERPL
jgi:GNAT superfamily N-acetyltransferase